MWPTVSLMDASVCVSDLCISRNGWNQVVREYLRGFYANISVEVYGKLQGEENIKEEKKKPKNDGNY